MKKIFLISFLAIFALNNYLFAHPILGVLRTFIQFRNAPPQPLSDSADPYHRKMLALGGPNHNIYTEADAIALDEESEFHFLQTIGFNFSLLNPNVIHNPVTDTRTLLDANLAPLAIWVPFLFGGDGLYNVLYDSANEEKNCGDWTVRNASNLVLFLSSGTFTAGTAAGQVYRPNDVISYGYTNHLRKNSNWQLKKNNEEFIVKGLRPGSQPPNSFNIPGSNDVHAPLQYITRDKDRCIGSGTDNVYRSGYTPATTIALTHHVVTFLESENQ